MEENKWVWKPAINFGGHGIKILHTLSAVKEEIETFKSKYFKKSNNLVVI